MDFICPSIADYIRECEKTDDGLIVAERKGEIKSIQLRFVIRASIGKHCTVEYDLERILDYVLAVTEFIGGLYWSERINFLTITLWLTPLRKIWCPAPASTNLIGKCQVNSGDTSFPKHDRRHIRVWRAEDWSKVVLHELFHAFNWDRLVPRTVDNQSEALVETMAVLVHCQILAGSRGWRKLLEAELQWMRKQVATLVRYPWKPEKTSVRSYYILKTSLLNNLEAFAHWLKQPEAKSMRSSWSALATTSVDQLLLQVAANPPVTTHSPCISMRMVKSQLSLCPVPLLASSSSSSSSA